MTGSSLASSLYGLWTDLSPNINIVRSPQQAFEKGRTLQSVLMIGASLVARGKLQAEHYSDNS